MNKMNYYINLIKQRQFEVINLYRQRNKLVSDILDMQDSIAYNKLLLIKLANDLYNEVVLLMEGMQVDSLLDGEEIDLEPGEHILIDGPEELIDLLRPTITCVEKYETPKIYQKTCQVYDPYKLELYDIDFGTYYLGNELDYAPEYSEECLGDTFLRELSNIRDNINNHVIPYFQKLHKEKASELLGILKDLELMRILIASGTRRNFVERDVNNKLQQFYDANTLV